MSEAYLEGMKTRFTDSAISSKGGRSEAYLEGMKTIPLHIFFSLPLVRSLPRRNENDKTAGVVRRLRCVSEAYLEGMKTNQHISDNRIQPRRPKPTSKE